jgi:GNAT superfamily N-acetyltransferase
MPDIRQVPAVSLDRIPEIDVSEEGAAVYRQEGTRLRSVQQRHRRPPRSSEEWEPEIRRWQGFVRDGGAALGAFDGDRLVGVAVLRRRLEEDTDQLAGLYIDRAWRRRGVATELVNGIVELARLGGAGRLYVSSAESESAVGFYLSRGFAPTAHPHPELFAHEPLDVHMVLELGS